MENFFFVDCQTFYCQHLSPKIFEIFQQWLASTTTYEIGLRNCVYQYYGMYQYNFNQFHLLMLQSFATVIRFHICSCIIIKFFFGQTQKKRIKKKKLIFDKLLSEYYLLKICFQWMWSRIKNPYFEMLLSLLGRKNWKQTICFE